MTDVDPSAQAAVAGQVVVARGRTAEVLAHGTDEVVKLFYTWCPREWADREAAGTSIAHSLGLPVPACRGIVTMGQRHGLVFERIRGPSLANVMVRRPWTLRGSAALLGRLHARVNQESGVGLPSLRRYLEGCIRKSDALTEEVRRYAAAVLSALPDGTSLCHFDFHPEQILLSSSGPVMIDWNAPYQGSAAADVARTLLLIRFGTSPSMGRIMNAVVNVVRGSITRGYVRTYLRLSPRTSWSEIQAWMVPVAVARLTEGIHEETEALRRFIQECQAQGVGSPPGSSGTSGARTARS